MAKEKRAPTQPKTASGSQKRGFCAKICRFFFYSTLLSLITAITLLYLRPIPDFKALFPDRAESFEIPGASFQKVKLNNVSLNVLTVGKPGNPLLVFLHGFPETALLSWSHQIEYFAKQNKYFIIAPDQRGYNTSDKPADATQYLLKNLVGDIVELIHSFNYQKGIVVGHDWGGFVAWSLALSHPKVVEKLAVMNIPHPDVFIQTLSSNLGQLKKSWYIFFFQIPSLPESFLSKDNFTRMAGALGSARPQTFSSSAIAKYKQAWGEPNALTGMLNYYRAPIRATLAGAGPERSTQVRRVTPPTLLLFGDKDSALDVSMAQPSVDACVVGKLKIYEGVTHWIQHEEPERVSKDLEAFFNA